jgi:hypothetical protein
LYDYERLFERAYEDALASAIAVAERLLNIYLNEQLHYTCCFVIMSTLIYLLIVRSRDAILLTLDDRSLQHMKQHARLPLRHQIVSIMTAFTPHWSSKAFFHRAVGEVTQLYADLNRLSASYPLTSLVTMSSKFNIYKPLTYTIFTLLINFSSFPSTQYLPESHVS